MKIVSLLFFFCSTLHAQRSDSIFWDSFAVGVDTSEFVPSQKSILGDSKLFLVRIDPQKVFFELKCSTSENCNPLTVEEWADTFGFSIVFNAGMYDLVNQLQSRAHMKDRKKINNPLIHPDYNGWFSIDTISGIAKVCDLYNQGNHIINSSVEGFQAMRMLDFNGIPMNWTKKRQSCSMLVVSTDSKGLIYLIFCRSPYLHATMISFLKSLSIDLKTTLYMEGGPETSLFLKNEKATIRKIGSYVSNTYPIDTNSIFWKIPNVIGVKLRTGSMK